MAFKKRWRSIRGFTVYSFSVSEQVCAVVLNRLLRHYIGKIIPMSNQDVLKEVSSMVSQMFLAGSNQKPSLSFVFL